jgi:hypothetical protein
MSSLKKIWLLGKTVLVWESAIAGLAFLAIAITALVNPGFVSTVESFDCFTRARAVVEYWCLSITVYAVIVGTSFVLGVFNSLIFLVVVMRRH